MISPRIPTIIRIRPTVWMLIHDTEPVTAYFRIAPAAMSSMEVPICIVSAYPASRASNPSAPQPARGPLVYARTPRLPSPPFETRTTHHRGRTVGRGGTHRRPPRLRQPRPDLDRAGRGAPPAPGPDRAGRDARPDKGARRRRGEGDDRLAPDRAARRAQAGRVRGRRPGRVHRHELGAI